MCMKIFTLIVLTVILLLTTPAAYAEKVLILSSGNQAVDNQLAAALENEHDVTLGPHYFFVGAGLDDQDVVILPPSYNWFVDRIVGDMPIAGQDALVRFI